MACYIRQRFNYNDDRRMVKGDDSENDEYEEAELGPELFLIMILDRPVFTIYTNSEGFVNTWFFRHIHYPNSIVCPGRIRRPVVVGLHIQLLDDMGNHNPPMASIHICHDGRVLIYHMYNASRLPTELEEFMTDPDNTFVGVYVEREMQALRYWAGYVGNITYRSLGFLAALRLGRSELLHADLTQLALTVLGKELVMEADPYWDKHTLLDDQVMYASISAYVSYELGRVLAPVS